MASGWSTHDGAAVLLRDGEIVAAVEEERLNRIKHSNFFPARAIRRCLEMAGALMSEVDIVAVNFSERTRDIFPADAGLPSVNGFLDDVTEPSATVRQFLTRLFLREFQVDISTRLHFCNHHLAHLWSAWAPSGFDEGLVVSLDGAGDSLSGMIASAHGDRVDVLRELSVDHSLGNVYSDSIRLLGYRRFDEYKVMGLAPYGDPERFRSLFESFFVLLPDGEYELLDRSQRWGLIHDAGLIPAARRASAPLTPEHRDFAAGLQRMLETIVSHVVEHFATATGHRSMCYAGGVAHNCTVNGRLLYRGLFDEVFVQPAAHDAGGALGAAISAAREHGAARTPRLSHVFVGSDVPDSVTAELEPWRNLLDVQRVGDVEVAAARLLADGAVLGWVQGRAEFGPRALGHRSILADPRPVGNRTRINGMVKKRESYRPFAPSILGEHLAEIVDLPGTTADYSFMTYAVRIREPYRDVLGAITHVDGTARVQSVSRDVDPGYWRLIEEFRKLTGVPVVLNTSFNNNAEPIVDSVADAVTCYLTTDIDALIVGDHLVRRNHDAPVATLIGGLRVSMSPGRKLVARTPRPDRHEYGYAVEATASSHFMTQRIDISAELHSVLLRADGGKTLDDLCGRHLAAERRTAVLEEVIGLWRSRAVALRP